MIPQRINRNLNISPPEIRRAVINDLEVITIEGYAITFEERSLKITDWWGDNFQEIISRSALESADLSEVAATFNHDNEKHLASTWAGTLTLNVDNRGLFYSLKTPNTSYAQDLVKLIEAGEVRGNSFEFTVEKDKWEYDQNTKMYTRHVTSIGKLYAVNPVISPAYPTSNITDVRSAEPEKQGIFDAQYYTQVIRELYK